MPILVTQFEPSKIFEHALAFHKSFELLSKSVIPSDGAPPSEQDVGTIAYPSLVLSAFTSEIYLKCLLCVETGNVPNGHNLCDLFMKLTDETKLSLDDYGIRIFAILTNKRLLRECAFNITVSRCE